MTQFSDNILWSKEITLLNVVLTNLYIYLYTLFQAYWNKPNGNMIKNIQISQETRFILFYFIFYFITGS